MEKKQVSDMERNNKIAGSRKQRFTVCVNCSSACRRTCGGGTVFLDEEQGGTGN